MTAHSDNFVFTARAPASSTFPRRLKAVNGGSPPELFTTHAKSRAARDQSDDHKVQRAVTVLRELWEDDKKKANNRKAQKGETNGQILMFDLIFIAHVLDRGMCNTETKDKRYVTCHTAVLAEHQHFLF